MLAVLSLWGSDMSDTMDVGFYVGVMRHLVHIPIFRILRHDIAEDGPSGYLGAYRSTD